MLNNIEIGNRIKQRRLSLGLSLQQIASEINMAKSSLSRYENGTVQTPSMPTLMAIASKLLVNVRWLTGESEEMGVPAFLTKSNSIEDIIASTKAMLTNQKGIMFNGKPASDEAIASILDAMEIGLKMTLEKENRNNSNNNLMKLRKELNINEE